MLGHQVRIMVFDNDQTCPGPITKTSPPPLQQWYRSVNDPNYRLWFVAWFPKLYPRTCRNEKWRTMRYINESINLTSWGLLANEIKTNTHSHHRLWNESTTCAPVTAIRLCCRCLFSPRLASGYPLVWHKRKWHRVDSTKNTEEGEGKKHEERQTHLLRKKHSLQETPTLQVYVWRTYNIRNINNIFYV